MKRLLSVLLCLALLVCIAPQALAATDSGNSGGGYAENFLLQLLVSFGIGLLIALIVLLVMRYKMNSVRPQKTATNYMVDGSYQLHEQSDIYLYSTVSKIRKPQNNNNK